MVKASFEESTRGPRHAHVEGAWWQSDTTGCDLELVTGVTGPQGSLLYNGDTPSTPGWSQGLKEVINLNLPTQ